MHGIREKLAKQVESCLDDIDRHIYSNVEFSVEKTLESIDRLLDNKETERAKDLCTWLRGYLRGLVAAQYLTFEKESYFEELIRRANYPISRDVKNDWHALVKEILLMPR